MKRFRDRQITPNFWLSEAACKCGLCEGIPPELEDEYARGILTIQICFREPLKIPVDIISGYRCHYWNEKQGGAPSSQHMRVAFDIQAKPFSGLWLAGWAEAQVFYRVLPEGGIGTYESKPWTLHYDPRGYKARWHNP